MKNKVLYLSYNGMMEPLGASQVLSYVYELSDKYQYNYYLLSLEKSADLEDAESFKGLTQKNNSKGINWYPIKYSSSKIGKSFNFIRFTYAAYKVIRKEKIKLVHCRSYFPTVIIYFLQKFIEIQYLFDTRGFAFDERADTGGISRDSFLFKYLKKLEKRLYQKAAGVVMLSQNGKDTILNNNLFSEGEKLKNISVIPTCVNLERFQRTARNYKKPINIGYIGTAVGWYDFEKTAMTLKLIAGQVSCRFSFFNGDIHQHDFIKKILSKYDIKQEQYTIEKVPFEEMPERLLEIDLSVFFIRPLFSKKASAATKLGELLACGIPILTNDNIGDHTFYIESNGIGKILDFAKINEYNFVDLFNQLLKPEVAKKCRLIAEKYFSLSKGAKLYAEEYQRILSISANK